MNRPACLDCGAPCLGAGPGLGWQCVNDKCTTPRLAFRVSKPLIGRLEYELYCLDHGGRQYEVVREAIGELKRLYRVLQRIIDTESVDNNGQPAPETGAAFLAREALGENHD